jgi:hypothetical protein
MYMNSSLLDERSQLEHQTVAGPLSILFKSLRLATTMQLLQPSQYQRRHLRPRQRQRPHRPRRCIRLVGRQPRCRRSASGTSWQCRAGDGAVRAHRLATAMELLASSAPNVDTRSTCFINDDPRDRALCAAVSAQSVVSVPVAQYLGPPCDPSSHS